MRWLCRSLPTLGSVMVIQAGCAAALWLRHLSLDPPSPPKPQASSPLLVEATGGAVRRLPTAASTEPG
jgi:hypothetical protein